MARLKKVLCTEKGKMMMKFDTPSYLTKACEIFVQELSFRAWICANSHHRKIILDSDIAEAIASIESYDFLNDVIRTHQGEHNSFHMRYAKKHCPRSTNQPSTSSQPHFNKYKTPFNPRSTIHSPIPPLSPTNIYRVPLSLPFLPQQAYPLIQTTTTVSGSMENMTCVPDGLGFFSTNIDNNVSTSGVKIPPQIPSTSWPNITNKCYMSTPDFIITNNIGAQDGGIAFLCPYIPSTSLHLSAPSVVSNNSGHIVTGVAEQNHTELEVALVENHIDAHGIANTNDGIALEAAIVVDDDPQQQGEQNTIGHHLNVVDRDNDNINWDTIDMANDSLLVEFWEQVMMSENSTHLPISSSTHDLAPIDNDIPELEGLDGCKPYLLDDIVSSASTKRKG
ncbi:hypothetical protein HU200_059507 [Digitaria exilis]|uniref:Core Histone H2A/H2B/H3 domain-containing protein n=1 Tax=Digitaria exilis TaxID=1010633 RepID=A0A835E2G8_9POAL|nr:hypothetical protein HU200_059507 [Digitaria exilis]